MVFVDFIAGGGAAAAGLAFFIVVMAFMAAMVKRHGKELSKTFDIYPIARSADR